MKTTKSMIFMQIIFLLNCLILSTSPIVLSAQVLGGKIDNVDDSQGHSLGNKNPKRGEVYTVEFSGTNIKDLHVKIGDETATVCFHSGAIPVQPSDCDIDVHYGSFTNGDTHTEAGNAEAKHNGKYISLWKGGGGITSGSFDIRFNNGTPGKAPVVVFTSDGNSTPFNGTPGTDWKLPGNNSDPVPILISTEVIPTLSEWGVIILILLTLSLGMVFLYKRESTLALAGNMSVGTAASKRKLFDKRLYAKVFGVVLLIGFGLLGLSYGYFGEITTADPFGTFVSAAIVAYMVHFWILKKSQAE